MAMAIMHLFSVHTYMYSYNIYISVTDIYFYNLKFDSSH